MSTKYYKYPRTYHLPWSLGVSDDDVTIDDIKIFKDSEVVVTEKMDGESCTMYRDNIHARSLDSRHHWTRDWVKSFHGTIAHNIPKDFRICGENVYAKHSIGYDDLESYFYGFSVWNEDTCLSWDDTLEYFSLLGITPVKVLYRGPFSMQALINVQYNLDFKITEGYVMRKVEDFKLKDFENNVGKFVRKNHVQTDQHWMYNTNIETNKLVIKDV